MNAHRDRRTGGTLNPLPVGDTLADGPLEEDDAVSEADQHVANLLGHGEDVTVLGTVRVVDLGDAGAAVVEIDQDGVSVAVTPPGLGAPESGCADITLDRAAVAATVPMGMGREIDRWAAVVAAASARAAFRLGIEYVSARKVFGRTLAEFQNTRFRLAELSAAVATTRPQHSRGYSAMACAWMA